MKRHCLPCSCVAWDCGADLPCKVPAAVRAFFDARAREFHIRTFRTGTPGPQEAATPAAAARVRSAARAVWRGCVEPRAPCRGQIRSRRSWPCRGSCALRTALPRCSRTSRRISVTDGCAPALLGRTLTHPCPLRPPLSGSQPGLGRSLGFCATRRAVARELARGAVRNEVVRSRRSFALFASRCSRAPTAAVLAGAALVV